MPKLSRRKFGPHFNEGARRLWLAMQETGDSQADVTRRIGASAGRVNHILWGDNCPSAEEITALHGLYAISGELWGKRAPRDFRPTSSKRAV